MWPWVGLTVVALGALLLAEVRQHRVGLWVSKPLASLGFLGVAWAGGALESSYGTAVGVGLVLCWWGDVLLIRKERRWFLAGLVAFLAGHVAYGVAFALAGLDPRGIAAGGLFVGVSAVPILRWLWPNVQGAMRGPVGAYVAVISGMVALACGASVAGGPLIALVGALLFYASDLFVARQRFVRAGSVNRLIGLPLYYGGQLLMAASVAR
jgi:uncharacterized membrane protein YhhN